MDFVQISSQGKPFGAVNESGMVFLPDAVMAPVVQDYQRDIQAYRTRHLPLVVGRIAATMVEDIHSCGLSGAQNTARYEAGFNIREQNMLGTNLQHCLQRAADVHGQSPPIIQLAQACARMLCAIKSFDQNLFGQASDHFVTVDFGKNNHKQGRHLRTGNFHRDDTGEQGEDIDCRVRTYLMRSSLPMEYIKNRATENMQGKVFCEGDIVGLHKIQRPEAGEIILINCGGRGSVHRSFHPPVQVPAQPSLFLRLTIVPPMASL